MIVDRRLLGAVVAVAAVAVAALTMVTARTNSGDETATDGAAPMVAAESMPAAQATVVRSPVPSEPPASSASPPATPSPPPTPTPPPASSTSTSLPADTPIEDLVAARRPLPDPATVYVDDGHGPSPEAAGDVAAATAVAVWSWRYDDDPNRLVEALAGVATAEAITSLLPSPEELDRRATVGEVAWALVAPGPAAPDPAVPGVVTVVVQVDQHVTTSTTAEVVVARTVIVRLRPVGTGWLVVEVAVAA